MLLAYTEASNQLLSSIFTSTALTYNIPAKTLKKTYRVNVVRYSITKIASWETCNQVLRQLSSLEVNHKGTTAT